MAQMKVIFVRHQKLLKTCLIVAVGIVTLLHIRRWMQGGLNPAEVGRTDLRESPVLTGPGRKVIRTGLVTRDGHFYLESERLRLFSGAMHYFRVVPEYWRDRMLKFKAAGLNTLETYVAWNVHEPQRGVFNFKGMYDLRRYIELAQDLGLHVIIRPGPYICAEWDMGGLPSWLLRDPQMMVRSTYKPYLAAVGDYIKRLAAEIGHLQYRYGGPILAFQLENEYGSYGKDKEYMQVLKTMFTANDLKELHFTCDNDRGMERGSMPGVMVMANFNKVTHGRALFSYLRNHQPSSPLMAMEFWPGWFDRWGWTHQGMTVEKMEEVLTFIVDESKASVNFYMFHGGTNFGFMSGANAPYAPQITSYDYDAPISEHGFMTQKYYKIRQMLKGFSKGPLPNPPPQPKPAAYGAVTMTSYVTLDTMLTVMEPVLSNNLIPMEMLNINGGSGQNHGFILYRKSIPKANNLNIDAAIRDRLQVIVNGKELSVLDWGTNRSIIDVSKATAPEEKEMIIDLLVENLGRVNYGHIKSRVFDTQRKGLQGTVGVDGSTLHPWQIYPLEMKKDLLDKIVRGSLSWKYVGKGTTSVLTQPCLLRGSFSIEAAPRDTFLLMKDWTKGVAFINGFNLGRYWNIGPQQTLYIPAPLLKQGENEILIFELHKARSQVHLMAEPVLDSTKVSSVQNPLQIPRA